MLFVPLQNIYKNRPIEDLLCEYFTADLNLCRSWYRELLGPEPSVYAFPNGSYRPSQAAIAENMGIQHVLLVGERAGPAKAVVHPRVTADGVTLRELRMRIVRAS